MSEFMFQTKADFLSSVRQSYPEAKQLNDDDLYKQVIDQYPEYASQIAENFKDTPVQIPEKNEKVEQFATDTWIGPKPKTDISQLAGYDEYAKLIENQDERRGFWEGISDFSKKDIWFVGGFFEAKQTLDALNTYKRLEKNEDVSDEDLLQFNTWLALQRRLENATWQGKAGDITRNAIKFWAEIAVTAAAVFSPYDLFVGDAAAIGSLTGAKAAKEAAKEAGEAFLKREAVRMGAKGVLKKEALSGVRRAAYNRTVNQAGGKALRSAAFKSVRSTLEKKLPEKVVKSMAGSKAMTLAAGGLVAGVDAGIKGVVLTAFNPGMVKASTAQQRLRQYMLTGDENTQRAVLMGVMDAMKENSAEMLGWTAGKIAGKIVPAKLKKNVVFGALFRDVAPKLKNPTVNEFIRWTKMAGADGILEEMYEERIGGFISGLFGLEGDDRAGLRKAIETMIPDAKQLKAEALAFALPGIAMGSAAYASGTKTLGGVGWEQFEQNLSNLNARIKETDNPEERVRLQSEIDQMVDNLTAQAKEEMESETPVGRFLRTKMFRSTERAGSVDDLLKRMNMQTTRMKVDEAKRFGLDANRVVKDYLQSVVGSNAYIVENEQRKQKVQEQIKSGDIVPMEKEFSTKWAVKASEYTPEHANEKAVAFGTFKEYEQLLEDRKIVPVEVDAESYQKTDTDADFGRDLWVHQRIFGQTSRVDAKRHYMLLRGILNAESGRKDKIRFQVLPGFRITDTKLNFEKRGYAVPDKEGLDVLTGLVGASNKNGTVTLMQTSDSTDLVEDYLEAAVARELGGKDIQLDSRLNETSQKINSRINDQLKENPNDSVLLRLAEFGKTPEARFEQLVKLYVTGRLGVWNRSRDLWASFNLEEAEVEALDDFFSQAIGADVLQQINNMRKVEAKENSVKEKAAENSGQQEVSSAVPGVQTDSGVVFDEASPASAPDEVTDDTTQAANEWIELSPEQLNNDIETMSLSIEGRMADLNRNPLKIRMRLRGKDAWGLKTNYSDIWIQELDGDKRLLMDLSHGVKVTYTKTKNVNDIYKEALRILNQYIQEHKNDPQKKFYSPGINPNTFVRRENRRIKITQFKEGVVVDEDGNTVSRIKNIANAMDVPSEYVDAYSTEELGIEGLDYEVVVNGDVIDTENPTPEQAYELKYGEKGKDYFIRPIVPDERPGTQQDIQNITAPNLATIWMSRDVEALGEEQLDNEDLTDTETPAQDLQTRIELHSIQNAFDIDDESIKQPLPLERPLSEQIDGFTVIANTALSDALSGLDVPILKTTPIKLKRGHFLKPNGPQVQNAALHVKDSDAVIIFAGNDFFTQDQSYPVVIGRTKTGKPVFYQNPLGGFAMLGSRIAQHAAFGTFPMMYPGMSYEDLSANTEAPIESTRIHKKPMLVIHEGMDAETMSESIRSFIASNGASKTVLVNFDSSGTSSGNWVRETVGPALEQAIQNEGGQYAFDPSIHIAGTDHVAETNQVLTERIAPDRETNQPDNEIPADEIESESFSLTWGNVVTSTSGGMIRDGLMAPYEARWFNEKWKPVVARLQQLDDPQEAGRRFNSIYWPSNELRNKVGYLLDQKFPTMKEADERTPEDVVVESDSIPYEQTEFTFSLTDFKEWIDPAAPPRIGGHQELHNFLRKTMRDQDAFLHRIRQTVQNLEREVGARQPIGTRPWKKVISGEHIGISQKMLRAVAAHIEGLDRIPVGPDRNAPMENDGSRLYYRPKWEKGTVQEAFDAYDAIREEGMPAAAEVVQRVRTEYEKMRQEMNAEVESLGHEEWIQHLNDYIIHRFGSHTKEDKDAIKRIKTRYEESSGREEKRKLPTYAEAAKLGLTPLEMSASKQLEMWARDVTTVKTNKLMLSHGSTLMDVDGSPIIIPIPNIAFEGKPAVSDLFMRQSINQLSAYLGVPIKGDTLAAQMKYLSDELMQREPNNYQKMKSNYGSMSQIYVKRGPAENYVKMFQGSPWRNPMVRSLEHINAWMKYMAIGVPFMSLFHPTSLLESFIAASGLDSSNPVLKTMSDLFGLRRPDIIKRMKEEAQAIRDNPEITDEWIRAGLQVDHNSPDIQMGLVDQDLNKFKTVLRTTDYLPYGDKLADGLDRFHEFKKWWDEWLWHDFHPILKLHMAQGIYARRVGDAAKRGDYVNEEMLRQDIATYVNDAFGGQEFNRYIWATPKSKQVLHLLMFAPDWTMSAANVSGITNLPVLRDILDSAPSVVAKDEMLKRYWPAMALIVLAGIPNALQLAIWLTTRPVGDPDDKPFVFMNEPGKRTHVDITPALRIFRDVPAFGYKGGDTGKRRVYLRWGKQAYEVFEGWSTKPLQTLMGKSSQVFRTAFEQATGSTTGGWDLPFKDQGLMGTLEVDGSFFDSRAGYIARKFMPFSVMGWIDGYPAAFFAPASRGRSKWKSMQDMQDIMAVWAEDDAFKAVADMGKENRLEGLVREVWDAAESNGYNGEEIFNRALSHVRSSYYSKFFKAINDGDMKKAEQLAHGIVRLNGNIDNVQQAMTRRFSAIGKVWSNELLTDRVRQILE